MSWWTDMLFSIVLSAFTLLIGTCMPVLCCKLISLLRTALSKILAIVIGSYISSIGVTTVARLSLISCMLAFFLKCLCESKVLWSTDPNTLLPLPLPRCSWDVWSLDLMSMLDNLGGLATCTVANKDYWPKILFPKSRLWVTFWVLSGFSFAQIRD